MKHFRSHMGPILGLAVSADGHCCATIGQDKSVKIYDIINFDMILMIRLGYMPTACEFIYAKGRVGSYALALHCGVMAPVDYQPKLWLGVMKRGRRWWERGRGRGWWKGGSWKRLRGIMQRCRRWRGEGEGSDLIEKTFSQAALVHGEAQQKIAVSDNSGKIYIYDTLSDSKEGGSLRTSTRPTLNLLLLLCVVRAAV